MNYIKVTSSQSKRGPLFRKGFSLIEAMIGVAILGIVFLSIPAAFVGIRKMNTLNDSMLRTNELVSYELESLRTLEFDTLETYVGTANVAKTPLVTHPQRSNIQYEVTTTLLAGSDELDGMLEALVVVSWTELGKSRETVGRSFFASNGLSDKKFPDAN